MFNNLFSKFNSSASSAFCPWFFLRFVAILGLMSFRPVFAMEFRLYYQPDLKINVVIAEGLIVAGDSERFLQIAPKADRDVEGHVVLVLNSLGGSVSEAFKFAKAMDKVGVYTIVPDDALCASACASIIYASGIRRNVVGTGRLGFHSCYIRVGEKIEESSFCNEKIADHAISRGLAHASVSLFVDHYGARDMAWVGRDVACTMLIGMCRPTLRKSSPALDSKIRPSFDCNKSHTLVETLICADENLARWDARMAIAYFTLRTKFKATQSLLNEQRMWLRESRNTCQSKECLFEAYKVRVDTLEMRITSHQ